MSDVGSELGRIDEDRVLIRLCRRGLRTMCLHERNQLSKYTKLQLEFDAIDHWLQGGLQGVVPEVLHHQQCDIQDNDHKIYGKQLIHDLSSPSAFLGHQPEQLDRLEDVDSRYDELLRTKPSQLQALYHVIPSNYGWSSNICRRECQDCGGNEKDDCVDDDEAENEAEDFPTLDHEMQAGIQHHGLTGNHDIETNSRHDQSQPQGSQSEEFQQIGDGVGDDAKSDGDEQGPEVQPSVVSESQKD